MDSLEVPTSGARVWRLFCWGPLCRTLPIDFSFDRVKQPAQPLAVLDFDAAAPFHAVQASGQFVAYTSEMSFFAG